MSSPDDILIPIAVGELMDKIAILEIMSDRIKSVLFQGEEPDRSACGRDGDARSA
jgi:hypothetical protein